ncbi:hypothetical protein [Paraburkholderia sp. J12]|uniref:hypothetical protein n=1 Tax=Paraburkholderia sp. J12 TaxID=2805432 RepID=UPI002ABDF11F|nr:hypothetical protein [Paraburkholderia sp. J12]
MSLSSEQAASALREIAAVENRSGQLYRYQRTAPMLILWGAIWALGFVLTDRFPVQANWIWIPLDIAGTLGCIYLGQRGKDHASATSWRWLASIVSIFVFYILVLNIFQPITGPQSAALIALIVALFYVLAGLWLGARFVVAGVVLAALIVFGYFMLATHFYLWMAVVGGGALILAGLWLRRA